MVCDNRMPKIAMKKCKDGKLRPYRQRLSSSDMADVAAVFASKCKRDSNDCWIWTGSSCSGYGNIYLDGKSIRAHRLSFIIHNGELPANAIICHHCDVPKCVNPQHIYSGSKQSNSDDMVKRGRLNPVRGTRHPLNKLTPEQVKFIFNERKFGCKRLAKKFSVSSTLIANIRKLKTWTHITRGLKPEPSPYLTEHWKHVHV